MERTENCGTCRFWREDKKPREGECRRLPPQLLKLGRGEHTSAWPPTSFFGWCGEFRRPDPPPAG